MAAFLRRFAKRLSISSGTTTPTKPAKEAVNSHSTSHRIKRSSSSRSSSKVNKKLQWMKKLFAKKVSPQDTKSKLECYSIDHEWINSSDSSLAIVNEAMSPEYAPTDSIHSYISSSDDECVGRIITLPVFSVTQSITDIHNTCILEWDTDCYTENEDCQELILEK